MKKLILFFNVFCLVIILRAQPVRVDTIQYNGEFAFNIVIVGDGYTEPELELFDEDARRVYEGIFSKTPFKEYKSFFNVFGIQVVSNESGIKCCKKDGHCSECEDPDNYFKSTIEEGTLVSIDSYQVINTVKSFIPDYDNIVVLVNSDYHFGTAYPWLTLSINPSKSLYGANYASNIVLHELGHSIGSLGDEYNTGSKEYHQRQIEYGYKNIDTEKNPEKVKWALWVGQNHIGVYDHIKGKSYIPHENCRMNNSYSEFCSVCTEQLILKFYEYVYTNKDEYFNCCASHKQKTMVVKDSVVVRFSALKTEPNTIKFNWYLDNQLIASGTDSVILSTKYYCGIKKLKVIVTDQTNFINNEEWRARTSIEFEWEISFEPILQQSVVISEEFIVDSVDSIFDSGEEISVESFGLVTCDTILQYKVYFDYDKSFISCEELTKFNELVSGMYSANSFFGDSISIHISILGYADMTGSEMYNQQLSLKRAYSVFDALTRIVNIPFEYVYLEGKGEISDYAELWQNRYVEIVIYYQSMPQEFNNVNTGFADNSRVKDN